MFMKLLFPICSPWPEGDGAGEGLRTMAKTMDTTISAPPIRARIVRMASDMPGARLTRASPTPDQNLRSGPRCISSTKNSALWFLAGGVRRRMP